MINPIKFTHLNSLVLPSKDNSKVTVIQHTYSCDADVFDYLVYSRKTTIHDIICEKCNFKEIKTDTCYKFFEVYLQEGVIVVYEWYGWYD